MTKDITKQEYSDWLEDTLRVLCEGGAKNIMVAAKLENGEVVTGYYDCDLEAKARLLAHVQADMTMAIVEANADRVRRAIEEWSEEGEDD